MHNESTALEAWEKYKDEEMAKAFGLVRYMNMTASEASAGKTLAEFEAEIVIERRSARIKKATQEMAVKAYSTAAKIGLNAAHASALVVNRSALVARNKSKWITVEQDLREASRNGLSDAAKGEKRGDWNEAKALAWAETKGRLQALTMSSLPGTVFKGS